MAYIPFKAMRHQWSVCITAFALSILSTVPASADVSLDLPTTKKIAEQQLSEADVAYNLGVKYYPQPGGSYADIPKAIEWFKKAAAAGHAGAQYRLGHAYETGVGLERDYTEAVRLYTLAAARGHKEAQSALAGLYAGGMGVAHDDEHAATLYRRAAEQGLPDAQYALAGFYAAGRGVEKDYTQAYFWFDLAARSIDAAMDRRDEVEAFLSPEDLAKTRAEIMRWQPVTKK